MMVDSNSLEYKKNYKLNEVCSMLNLKAYVLRFWESEFNEICPEVSSNGEKLYSKKDIEAISQIKKFLFENKYTIEKTKIELQRMEPSITISNKEEISQDNIQLARQKLIEILSLTNQIKRSFS